MMCFLTDVATSIRSILQSLFMSPSPAYQTVVDSTGGTINNRNGVVVETVPNDEDDELRDLHSIWRNRAPGPGQWIEPV